MESIVVRLGEWVSDALASSLFTLIELQAQSTQEGTAQEGTAQDDSGGAILEDAPTDTTIIEGVNLGDTDITPEDLSVVSMFLRADIIVKAVMLVLVLASFWSWAIIFEKVLHMRRVNRRTSKFEESFWSGGSVDDLYDRMGQHPNEPMAAMFAAAMREWRRSVRGVGSPVGSLQQRIERVMHVTSGREMGRLEKYMTFLASVGATAPFVGLFGTVWGIMNSFQQIAIQKSTNLAVVAPGIAEALFATALGLVAAIPAVVAYNKLSNDLGRYANRLEGFAGEFNAIISRQIDEGGR